MKKMMVVTVVCVAFLLGGNLVGFVFDRECSMVDSEVESFINYVEEMGE